MKKLHLFFYLLVALKFLAYNEAFSQSQCYLQLYPGDNSKIIFQILTDKDYADVAIYVNFYSNDNTPIKLNKKYMITNSEHKYLLAANGVYSFVLDHSFKDVDHISLGAIYEKVPLLGLEKNNYQTASLDDGDKDVDAGYASGIAQVGSSTPLRDVAITENNYSNDPCNIGGKLQIVNQNKVIRSSYICDLENNGEAQDGDFWWSVFNSQTADIVPRNGAKFFLMWNCPSCYDTIGCRTLKDMDTKGLLSNNSISKQNLKPGNLIAYVTRNDLYGIMRIENFIYGKAIDLKISFRTFHHQ